MIKTLASLVLSLTIIGCSNEIDLGKVIDKNSPIEVTAIKLNEPIDPEKKRILIQPGTTDWKLLEKFAENNMNGWRRTPVSYQGDVYLSQGDFRLITWYDGGSAVINFPDENGEFNQYEKQIKKGELDFLFN